MYEEQVTQIVPLHIYVYTYILSQLFIDNIPHERLDNQCKNDSRAAKHQKQNEKELEYHVVWNEVQDPVEVVEEINEPVHDPKCQPAARLIYVFTLYRFD